MILRVQPVEFHFRALQPIRFPRAAGNTFRGAIGDLLRSSNDPAFQAVFAPKRTEGPSGFADPPRPFVLRASHLDGQLYERGESFTVRANVFTTVAADALARAFGLLPEHGLGPVRSKVELAGVRQSPEVGVDVTREAESAERLRIVFQTPTDLESADFSVVFKRARDRVSALIAAWQGGIGDLPDFAGLGRRAEAVETVKSALKAVEAERTSSRTGQRHSIGGFTGQVEYCGELGEFVPWLEAATWTGIGRHTVWGNGSIELG